MDGLGSGTSPYFLGVKLKLLPPDVRCNGVGHRSTTIHGSGLVTVLFWGSGPLVKMQFKVPGVAIN